MSDSHLTAVSSLTVGVPVVIDSKNKNVDSDNKEDEHDNDHKDNDILQTPHKSR